MNLVINAAEAIGPDRPGTILLRAGTEILSEGDLRKAVVSDHSEPGEYVCLEVRDSGPGLDPDTQARIFDPFFTTKFTGRGLGLSAVMGIVRSHNGSVRVQSEPGKGATFTVFLPPGKGVPRPPDIVTAEKPAAVEGAVLVIDDEEIIRHTARAILEAHGLRVFPAATGRAGVEVVRRLSGELSLVLLDLTMPSMSGDAVVREIRSISPHIPVLLSSGYSEMEVKHRVTLDEVTGFLQKPYTATQLMQQVRAALGLRSRTGMRAGHGGGEGMPL